MANITVCHGFNVPDNGKSTTRKLLPYLNWHQIQEANYGHFGLFGVRAYNDNVAATVAGMAQPNSIGIGHSNGCAILTRAAKISPKLRWLILINPALDKDTMFPDSLERIDVYYNRYDDTVGIAKWLIRHEWGELGRVGYRGNDCRVRNHDQETLFGVRGHSTIFDHKPVQMLADHLVNSLGIEDYCSRCGT